GFLVDVVASRHVETSGQVSDIDYYLRFDPGGWIQLRCGADGESLALNPGVARENAYEMGRYGRVTMTSIKATAPIEDAINKRLTHVEAIVIPKVNKTVGFRFTFGAAGFLIFNWGDDIASAAELPDYLVDLNPRFAPALP